MAQINLEKVVTANNAPVGKLGIFVTAANEAFLIDEAGAVYAFGGGATSFLALSDVPASYTGQGGKVVSVNVGETGLEFISVVEYTAGDGLDLTGSVFKLGDDIGITYTPPTNATSNDGSFRIDGALFSKRDSGANYAEIVNYIDGSNPTGGFIQVKGDIVNFLQSAFGGLGSNQLMQSYKITGSDNAYSQFQNQVFNDTDAQISMGINGEKGGLIYNVGITIRADDGLGTMEIVDEGSAKGIVYAADYSANFTDRSLVDKAYVDSVGGGTVTSVAISGTDGIEVDSGSPITGSGTITLGLNATTIKSTAFPEAVERANNTVLFDQNYIIGNAGARSGNILFDFTGAKLGAWTEMRHADASAFTFPTEAMLMFASADISTTVDNYFLFVLTDKTGSSEVVKVFHALEGGI